ncbi:hypothetical protein HID58_012952 [Brassica napus]|uniref:BnaAnng10950D protein n=4 Tax=Brassica TaxID=3705 RepID=A0A078IKS7_BRANA|nr:hypothetical protein HID58_012952 [Brassica napus]CAF2132230.1 unnamed protein product [Brassica napus]CAF2265580.1 unnamed protein product [Brassica napus]CDY51655.1 BnaAnng10950D [Brassica napus]CDY69690.1 BnaAnng31220D [Brassica napus]
MAQFSILLADLKVYNHRRGLSLEFWAMARFNIGRFLTPPRQEQIISCIWELANQQIYFSDLKMVLREDCVAELNNYIDPLPENLDGKLLTRILEVDARMGNLEKVMELIRCCKGVIEK